MCGFFSCIAHRDGRILFTGTDSHEYIIRVAGLTDDRVGQERDWVRLECRPGVNGAWQHIVHDTEPVWWRLRAVFAWERIEQLASAALADPGIPQATIPRGSVGVSRLRG